MERGHRLRWVEGYLEEQSTQSIRDFVKQRRRWMQGLAKVSLYAPVNLKWRLSLGLNTIMWNLGPFATMYTIAHYFFGFRHEWWIIFLANFSFSSSLLTYLLGLNANLDEYGIKNRLHRFGWLVSQIALFPVFSFMESVGVLAAFFKPAPGFHVVKK
jgi:egghead protein (zeste-white 4 protein)